MLAKGYRLVIDKIELQPTVLLCFQAWAGILDKARHGGMHKRGPN